MNKISSNQNNLPYNSLLEWFNAGLRANQRKIKQFTTIDTAIPAKYIIAFATGFFIKLLLFGILFMIVFQSLNQMWAK